jgi:large subunit ribosomal protein L10
MRAEKQNLTKEYLARLNASPFFIVVNYKGLKVGHMTELRKRLNKAGAEIHVVKNSIFRIAAKEAGVGDLNGTLAGSLAVVTGQRDISTAAKVVKTFGAELDRLKVQVWLSEQPAPGTAEIMMLADLPSMEVLRAKLLGVFNAPASKLVGCSTRRPARWRGAASPADKQAEAAGRPRGKAKTISSPFKPAGMENKQTTT